MNKQKSDFSALTGIVTTLVGIIYLTMCYFVPRAPMGDPLDPIYFPIGLGVLLTVFGLILFLKSDKSIMVQSIKGLKNMSHSDNQVTRMIAITCVCGILYGLIFEHAGFVISTILFLSSILFMTNGKKIATNLIVSTLFSIGIFILFNHGLGITLPTAFELF